jgi:nitroreductase
MLMTTPSQTDVADTLGALIHQRRATPAFLPDPVPDYDVHTALSLAAEAPSGYNLQPWRFLLLTEHTQKARLRQAAMNQDKITQAPLVIIAYAQREGWKENAKEILQHAAQRRGRDVAGVDAQFKQAAAAIEKLTPQVWLNRQVMIAFTHLMLAFESLGWDTAPMEGFDAGAVKQTFNLPTDAEVVALLAVGRARDRDTPNPGRLEVSRIAFRERLDTPYHLNPTFAPFSS